MSTHTRLSRLAHGQISLYHSRNHLRSAQSGGRLVSRPVLHSPTQLLLPRWTPPPLQQTRLPAFEMRPSTMAFFDLQPLRIRQAAAPEAPTQTLTVQLEMRSCDHITPPTLEADRQRGPGMLVLIWIPTWPHDWLPFIRQTHLQSRPTSIPWSVQIEMWPRSRVSNVSATGIPTHLRVATLTSSQQLHSRPRTLQGRKPSPRRWPSSNIKLAAAHPAPRRIIRASVANDVKSIGPASIVPRLPMAADISVYTKYREHRTR